MPERACLADRTPFHPRSVRPAVLSLAIASAFAAPSALVHAQTLPAGGVAVHGQAAISNPSSNQLRVVTQNGIGTRHSAIDWQSFSISSGSSAVFVQPDAGSTSINRVVTNTPSTIFGNLSSNGRLVLVNQSGIAVGAGAVVDTAGFTASALRMGDADALAGRLRFGDANASMGGAGGITVGGRITARDGDVVLVAPNIDIGGSALLQAPNGSTILAAGQQVAITGRGLEGITLLVQAPADQVRNLGRLEGDAVGIFAGTLRHSGEIQATTASMEGGRVVLKAAGDAVVDGAGSIVATGRRGGRVDVLGNRVAVADQAVIDVSGALGGGSIRVGGDYQGKNAALPNAQMTYLGTDALLRADAIDSGDGGRVIVWADDVTRAYGSLSANAGLAGGNGGLVETSGHRYLDANGARVTAGGSGGGLGGTWLLDPASITITHAASAGPLGNMTGQTFVFGSGTVGFFAPVDSVATSTMTDANINAALNTNSLISLTIQTSQSVSGGGAGDITFDGAANGPIVIDRSNNGGSTTAVSLILNADRNIVFGSGSTTFQRSGASTGKALVVELNPGITAAGTVQTSAGASVVMNGNNDELGLTVKNGKVWNNAGTVAMNGQAIIRLPNEGGYATFNNLAAGALNINTSGTWSFLSDSNPQGGILNNAGTINVNGIAGGNGTSWEAFYSNQAGGTLHLGAGKFLSMQNAATLGGSLVLDSGSELRLSQQFIGTPAISNATFSGSGKLSVASGVTANFSNNSGTLGELDIQGTVSTLAGTLAVGDYVQSGGSFGGSAGLTVTKSFSHASGSFAPTGDLSITQATGGLVFNESAALNALALSAPAGGISFSGALTVTGNLALSAGGAINQTGGSLVVNGATTLNAPGNVVDLSPGSNDFLSIAGSTGALTVVDINSLVVGAAGINSSNGNVSLSATGIGSLTLNGNINAGTGNVTLNSRGVSAPGGAVTGSTLTVNSSLGSVGLNGANNVTAARLSGSGASSISFNNQNTNYALSGSGGNLTVTSPGQVTVDQPLNFATGINITSTNGISLGANVTPGANLSLATGAGPINQTAGTLFANSGTASFSAGTGDISLTSAGNDFNVVNLSGGHITTIAGSNGLIVNSLASGANKNVFLQAGAGGMILPGTPVNAGTGQISFISGSTLLGGGALSGSDILLQAPSGLNVAGNIAATGNLLLSATGGSGITQAAGTSIAAAGTTTIAAGPAGAITLTESGNNFGTVTATGGAISLRDVNAINLGAVNAGTSLAVNANGNVTQTAPLVISGTTAVNAGTGNVTLTMAGNNLNSLGVAGNAINVVEGAGSSLTVTSLSSGANQPVSLAAGHTLTLPGTAINTGTADIALSSGIGPLIVPALLSGRNVSLSAATDLTLNGGGISSTGNVALVAGDAITLNANIFSTGGNFSATNTNAAKPMLVTQFVSANGVNINLAGGLTVQGTGGGGAAVLAQTSGQTVNAKYVEVLAGASTGNAEISSFAGGGQSIITTGMNASSEGLVVRNASAAAGVATISSNGGGAQNITVNDANFMRVVGGGGSANISTDGNQTVLVRGVSSGNALQIGAGFATGDSDLSGNNQSIVLGQAGQSGSLLVQGGSVDGVHAGLINLSGSQTVSTTGFVNLQGGSGSGGAGGDCGASGGLGTCAFIGQGGAGLQKVSAATYSLTGGSSGSHNVALIGSSNGGSSQLIEITGGGNLNLVAGSGSGSSNEATVFSPGSSQTISFLAGGNLNITGGTVGSSHVAGVKASSASGTQTVSGASAIVLNGGASGGVFGVGNSARLESAGNQTITVGSGGISISGGGGTGAETDNDAQVWQSGGAGTTQSVTVNGGGAITIVGGSSAKVNVGGSGHGSKAKIQADGTSQTINFTAGGAINLTGGTNGSRAFAMIESVNGSQTISGAPNITMVGGANGGVDGEGNRAVIQASAGAQTIAAGNVVVRGGASGIENRSVIFGATGQTLTATGLAMFGGVAGGGFSDGNLAYIGTGTNASQLINLGAGGLQMTGGGGALSDNAAQIEQLGTGTQTINSNGAIVMAGGSSAGVNVGGSGHGSRASIYSEGSTQTINMLGANRSISLTGGTVGSRNFAQIFAENTGNQVINGASSIALTGGTSGGVVGEGNSAYISANSGSQTIAATSISLTGGAAGTENLAAIQQSSSTGATTGTQSITIGGGGAVTLQGGGGTTNLARIRSFGATQTLNYSAGGTLNLTGGTGASLDFARVEAVNGNQNILGSPNIALAGGAGGGADLNGNFASITANNAAATQTIVSSAMTLNAGAAGINNYAVITAPVQNLTVHGNLAITGGGSAASLDGTTGGGARIGANGGAASTLVLAVDNNITLTGGSVAGAAIGSNVQGGTSTAISITAGGNVTLNPGSAPTAGARIGSPAAGPAAGDILVVAGGSIGLNGTVAGETAVRTLGKVKLEGNTLAIGNAVTGSEVDLHGLAGVSLSGVAAVSATATSGNSLEVVVDSGAFSNTAGASALTAAAGGRWLVYSVDPANDTRGGLVPAFKQYDAVPGDTVLGSGNGFLHSVVPTATASLVAPISKAYDGGVGAALTGANYSVTGIDGDVVVLNNPASGSYDNKNVGSGKTVTATGLVVVSASNAGIPVFGYNPSVAPATGAVGSIGTASLVVSTLDVNKTYDGGTTAAGAAVISSGSLFGSDTLSGGTFAFTDRNVGTGKTVTVAGISVNDGNGGANYSVSFANNTTSSIGQLPLATWTGGAGNNLWSSAGNWAGGAIPDGANVAAVSIPAGSGDVVFNSAVPATSLQSLASARPLGIGSGSLQVSNSMVVADFSQSGGAVGGAGSLSVGNSFSQSGGSIAMGGPITIAQNSGNLSFASLQAPTVRLAAPNGSISQTGPVITGSLATVSQTGTALTQGGNQIGALLAQNTGSGDIVVANSGALAVVGIDNAGGHIALTNTGPVHTLGPVVAAAGRISLVAANPGGDLTLDGAVVASDQVYLRADNLFTQNSAVVGPNGVLAEAAVGPIGIGLLATAIGSPVDYRVAGVSVAPPPSEISVAALIEEVQSAAAAPLVVFAEQFKEIVADVKVKDLLDTNADGSRKNKRTDDTIVTEGDICR